MQVFQIRILRTFLIGLITVVSIAVLVNYVQRWRRRSATIKPVTQILSPDLLRSAINIEHKATENGVLKFRVSAKKLLETRKYKELLEGIEAWDFNPDGTERNHISSQKGEYDTERKQVFFFGDVRLRLGKDIELRMETLHYNMGDQTGYSDDRFQLASAQATGTARGIRYDNARRHLELLNDLSFVLHRRVAVPDETPKIVDYQVTAQQGYYSEEEHLIRLQGTARLVTETGALAGDLIEATFSADKKHITGLACDGNAVYESKSDSDTRTLRGDHIDFDIGPQSRALENIHVLGQAGFAQKSADGELKLVASEIHLTMDPVKNLPRKMQSQQGVLFEFMRETQDTVVAGDWLEAVFVAGGNSLESMHVHEHASMKIPSGAAAPYELQAEDIRVLFHDLEGRSVPGELQADRGVQWKLPGRTPSEPDRSLAASSLKMQYSEKGDSLQSGTASGGVILTALPKPGPGGIQVRRLQCDQADFNFYPANNRLQKLSGEGHVQVFYSRPADGGARPEEFRTSSSSIRALFREVDQSPEAITQSGGFIYQDGTNTATAGVCEFTGATEKLVLSDRPSFADPDSSTSGERIEFDRKEKVLSVHRNVRSILKFAAGQSQGFLAASANASSSGIVTADELLYWNDSGKAHYSGNAHFLSSDQQLQAQSLVILNHGEGIEAEGNVRHLIFHLGGANQSKPAKENQPQAAKAEKKITAGEQVQIRSAQLQYTKTANSIHYAGGVTLDSDNARLRADSMDLFLDSAGKNVERAKAWGNPLVMTQTSREVKGTEADFEFASGKIVVTGSPAELYDYVKKEKTTAARLTFFTTNDSILAVR